jgi:hypothetical protein
MEVYDNPFSPYAFKERVFSGAGSHRASAKRR